MSEANDRNGRNDNDSNHTDIVISGGIDAQLDLSAAKGRSDERPFKVAIYGKSTVQLLGTIDELELEVLDGSTVDARTLVVQELTVMLEQSTAHVRPNRLAAGFVSYGSVLTVGGSADTSGLKTTNAGRVVTEP